MQSVQSNKSLMGDNESLFQEHEECQRHHQTNGAGQQTDGGASEGAEDGHEQRKGGEGVSVFLNSQP